MEIFCTRPGCSRPQNHFSDLDDPDVLKTVQQKYCLNCGMPLILGGRYIPSKLLGQGGFGAAFLSRDRYTPRMRQCVVKQFQPAGNLNPKALKVALRLFEQEATALETLGNEHAQIPNLYAFFPGGDKKQFFYLVQEFIDGNNLEEELEQKEKFSEAEVVEVLEEVLRILQYVHHHGSIHRDIKPSNIMRHRSGRIYLLDFGAVKQVTTPGAAGGRSTGIYSMGFAPPEQVAGSQVYPATDLYALAATCLNLLTGKEIGELYDSFHNVWNWQKYAPGVNDNLAAVLNMMLKNSPSQRFQSAKDALTALQPTQITLPPSPPQPPVSQSPVSQSPVSQPPVSQSPVSPPVARQGQFELKEVLISAGFTGVEGALLFILSSSLLPSPGISFGIWGMVMGGLIYAQYKRIIEAWDPWILAAITFLPMIFFPLLRGSFNGVEVIIIAILAGAGAIAVTAVFRLIYQVLSRIL